MVQGQRNIKRKIAIFGIKTYPAFAGADRVVENIIDQITDEFDLYIYLAKNKEKTPPIDSENLHFIYVPSFKGKHLRAFSYFFFCAAHLFFRANYDFIHAHNSDVGLFTYLLRQKYKGRIIGTFHGNPYESAKWGKFARWYLKYSEKLFIKSCAILTSVSQSKQVPGKTILHIPNGMEHIDPEKFRSYTNVSIDYEKLKIQKGEYILFAAGRLDRRKGLHHLLTAYQDAQINKQLIIVSDFSHDKTYSESIDDQVHALKSKDLIVIKKLLPKNDLFDLIINARLVVFPSEIEAMSMFLLEVLACGTPIVCAAIESNIQILGADYSYLFNSAQPDSLSAVMQGALTDSDHIHGHRELVREMKVKYNWQDVVNEYSALYRCV